MNSNPNTRERSTTWFFTLCIYIIKNTEQNKHPRTYILGEKNVKAKVSPKIAFKISRIVFHPVEITQSPLHPTHTLWYSTFFTCEVLLLLQDSITKKDVHSTRNHFGIRFPGIVPEMWQNATWVILNFICEIKGIFWNWKNPTSVVLKLWHH